MPLFILFSVILLSTAHSANVLVIGGMKGSHLYLSIDIANKLIEFGHDVTVLTLCKVNIDNKAFHLITLMNQEETDVVLKGWDVALQKWLHHPSKGMAMEYSLTWANLDPSAKRSEELAHKYFNGEEFSNIVDTGNFDLIVLEHSTSYYARSSLNNRDIPIIGFLCHGVVQDINDRFSLQRLINSEPGKMNDVTMSPPTFVERWQTLERLGRVFIAKLSISEDTPAKTDKRPENSDKAYYDVAFINDHPAFTFPFLKSPNAFYLGTFHLEDRPLKPLPDDYLQFFANCPYKYTVLFSFGSFIRDITVFSGTSTILETLRHMSVCVIIMSKIDLSLKFDLPAGNFLQRSWIPQKDLLGSGKLDFFISHCGNNGKLEAIHYNVPLICIPLCTDGYFNGRLVAGNKFGLLLTWEVLTQETLTRTVDQMLVERGTFVTNMRRAAEIARNDPGSGVGVLKFYTDLLIKNKNADYLINRIISNQSTNEIYNLDIAAIASILTLCLIGGVLFCLVKCFRMFCWKIVNKIKSD